QLHIVATSVVETERPEADPMTCTDAWPLQTSDYSLYDYLHFGGPIVDTPALRDLAKSLQLLPGDRCAHVASRMLNAINDRFTYEKGVTTATSPITDVLEHGRGVCQ